MFDPAKKLKDRMKVSIIIPTYNRVKDLSETLDSIKVQTTLPEEVIIVDDSDNNGVKNLVELRKNEFKEKGVTLKYIRNKRGKSLAIARNIGIEHAKGDIVLFLDDDVILDKEYITEILKIYKANSKCLGVQGYITNLHFPKSLIERIKNIVLKILFINFFERNKCRVLPSTQSTYPYPLNGEVICQWLSGCNQSYRKHILQKFKFDERLMRYSLGEDEDLSYRIFKQYPNSLYITPNARLIHKASNDSRMPNKTLIYMQQIYKLYFFYKNIDQNIKNKLIFLWSRFGLFILYLAGLLLKPSKSRLIKLKYLLGAYLTCLRHLEEIKEGDLKFFNKGLMEERR